VFSVGFSPAGGNVGFTRYKVNDVDFIFIPDSVPGMTPLEHEKLRQLIHFISEGPGSGFATGAFKEILPLGAPFPASVTWYTDATKTQKIVEKIIVRNPNKTPATISWNMYALDGVTVVGTIVDTISYISVFETTRTRAIS
jgi:hypothetical protein